MGKAIDLYVLALISCLGISIVQCYGGGMGMGWGGSSMMLGGGGMGFGGGGLGYGGGGMGSIISMIFPLIILMFILPLLTGIGGDNGGGGGGGGDGGGGYMIHRGSGWGRGGVY